MKARRVPGASGANHESAANRNPLAEREARPLLLCGSSMLDGLFELGLRGVGADHQRLLVVWDEGRLGCGIRVLGNLGACGRHDAV